MQPAIDTAIVVQPERVVVTWIVPVAIFFGALLLGYVFERIILRHLRKLAERTPWRGDEVIISALHNTTTVAAALLGAYTASFFVNLPPNIVILLQKALKVLIILAGTVVLGRIAVGFVRLSTARDDGKLPSASILTYITRAAVYVIGILVILQSLGVSITPLLTALGVGGLAVALALQDTLSNLFAGIHILASKKIRTGDFVRLEGGQEGYIDDISWRSTSIRSLSNFIYIVPNNKLSTMIVTDYDQPQRDMSLSLEIGVAYGSDLDHVERVTMEVAREMIRETTGAVADFEPIFRYSRFGEFSITFSVSLRIQSFVDQYLLRHEFLKRLYARYNREGIVIPVPARTVYLKPAEMK